MSSDSSVLLYYSKFPEILLSVASTDVLDLPSGPTKNDFSPFPYLQRLPVTMSIHLSELNHIHSLIKHGF